MAITPDFSFFKEIFTFIEIFDRSWIFPVILAILITVLITRDTHAMMLAFLPVWIGLNAAGIAWTTPHFIVLALAIFTFVTATVGVTEVGKILKATGDIISNKRGFREVLAGEGTAYTKRLERSKADDEAFIQARRQKKTGEKIKYDYTESDFPTKQAWKQFKRSIDIGDRILDKRATEVVKDVLAFGQPKTPWQRKIQQNNALKSYLKNLSKEEQQHAWQTGYTRLGTSINELHKQFTEKRRKDKLKNKSYTKEFFQNI